MKKLAFSVSIWKIESFGFTCASTSFHCIWIRSYLLLLWIFLFCYCSFLVLFPITRLPPHILMPLTLPHPDPSVFLQMSLPVWLHLPLPAWAHGPRMGLLLLKFYLPSKTQQLIHHFFMKLPLSRGSSFLTPLGFPFSTRTLTSELLHSRYSWAWPGQRSRVRTVPWPSRQSS